MNIVLILILVSLLPKTNANNIPNRNISFIVLSDPHLDIYSNGMAIDPSEYDRNNDVDQKTLNEELIDLKNKISQGVIKQPQFIILLGDLVGHKRTTNSVSTEEARVFKQLKTMFYTIPIIYAFGNNDSFKIDYGPFNSDKESPYHAARMQGWQQGFLSNNSVCKVRSVYPCIIKNSININDGYYSSYIAPKLKLVVLNTVLFSVRSKDSQNQSKWTELEWLSQQLKTACKKHESVLIAMHIPPGKNVYDDSSFWVKEVQDKFLQLANQYKNTIIGMLAAHTHMEEMKVIKNNVNQLISEVWYTPALSTSHGNAPAVKIFELQKEYNNNWVLKNYILFNYIKEKGFTYLYDYNSVYCHYSKNIMSDCAKNLNRKSIERYYSAGNNNFKGKFRYPDNIDLIDPEIE